ncbi:MAG: site-specific integrase [Chitinophagaceae bacterium]|jgi:integrase|nr:site-specific integrase [Chitinophagaceae bacterium]
MSNGKKATAKAKEPIRIRFKKLTNGNQSIYFDYYKDGQRQYEFLKMYLVPEKTPLNKEENAQTMRRANAIKSQKIAELYDTAHGFTVKGGRSKMNVIDYIQDMSEKKRIKAGGGERTIAMGYMALAKQIEDYSGLHTTFKHIDKKYCAGFIEYLKTAKNKNNGLPLNENTVFGYMKKFEAVLNSAITDEVTDTNSFKQIKQENKPKKRKTEIVYLTIDEVKRLETTKSLIPCIRQAFLFSCYTGLRFSDVQGLTWGKLQRDNEGGIFINYIQKKTQKQEYLPIPQKAVEFLPARADASDADRVFKLPTGGYCNWQLRVWGTLAGIKKHITFHIARHTYATLLLSLGAGIETISKNLGHSEIKTTQAHYSAIENKLQRQAVSLFDKLNGLTD